MKLLQIVFITATLSCCGFFSSLSAQALFDLEASKSFTGDADMEANYVLSKEDIKRGKSLDNRFREKMKIAKDAKKFDGPIIITRKGVCVKIACSQKDCDSCTLLWSDRNKDGNINPKKELRCVCKKTRKLCEIQGKKIRCR